MYKILRYFLVFFLSHTCLHAQSLENEQVVTIHGILGSGWNMYYLAGPLEKEKMLVTHWDYPSRDKKIAEHAHDLALFLQKMAAKKPSKPIHFLTHSMGGLILRAALNDPACPVEAQIGKAVLLAPPNQGASWGRLISALSLAGYIGKDQSAKELMEEFNFEHLGQFPDTMEVLVIAGNFNINPFISGENDGTVAVAETYLTTPHHHKVINAGHKSILLSRQAALLAKNFFQSNVE